MARARARASLATPLSPLATPPCPSSSVLPRSPPAPSRAHPRQWEARPHAAAPISVREVRARRVFTVSMEMRDAAMQHGARRGPETPQGVALTGHVVPVDPANGSPRGIGLRGEVLLPMVSPCCGDTVVAVAEELQEVMTTPTEDSPEVVDTEEDHHEVPPTLTKESHKVLVPATKDLPEVQAEQLRCNVPRGTCLIHNWQEERATNHLDNVVPPELGSEGFAHRHGHRGLLAPLHPPVSLPCSTTKDAFRPPYRIPLLARGQREAMLERMLYQKYQQELMEEIHPPPGPMETLSTTHRDFQAGGFQPTPPPATQLHNYHMEQPHSFWLEQAHSVPGVTCIRTGDSPFRRNAAFSTPITEYLEQPLPYEAASHWPQPSMQ
uniref:Sperm-associated antigen 8 n=1 Tax=Pavo cristatus TaxID=9049 RepID=A0A8C9FZU3_PAVCR